MRVAMLGPLEVRADSGEVLEIGGARLRALLILLALQPGHVVTTARLADGLWGERLPAEAGNALQALASRLRRTVPQAVIAARPAGYQLVLAPESVDVTRFERLAAAGHAELRDDPARAAVTLREALGLWRGPALADVADAEFAQAVIARLDELWLAAIQDRIAADLRVGASAPLIAELEGLVVAHPLREPLVGLLMRALQAVGRRGAALAAYEQARSRLVDQLGVGPSAELAALHLEILRSDQPGPPAARRSAIPDGGLTADRTMVLADGVPAATGGAPPGWALSTNLRAELTSFVGRDAELTQVAGLLGQHRLTTLTGPGGAGKTRLAVETARAELASMPDGVWLVEFAPVTDPAEVAPTVLATLGIRDRVLIPGGRSAAAQNRMADPVGRLVSALSGKRALLVLDNCEHLVTAVAALAGQVLAACPGLRIMATSREPLNITGEALWPVRPLAMPPAPSAGAPSQAALWPGAPPAASGGGSDGTSAISGYASVQLLAERARAVCPDFEVSESNAAAVARICRALDGMPLAIELAAARFRAMSPAQVAARLDDMFRLLIGGSRTALPRHQTLRAVVGWSWDLLDDAERGLWRRFSVFAGGATVAAAERVCAGGLVTPGQVPDLLTALVDKSILTVRHDGDEPRYQMLEIIRAYGQERLAEAGERDAVRAAHAACFRALAEAAQLHLREAEQLSWLRQLTDDQDNLHAAIRGAIAAGDAATAIGLAGALGWYWWLRGLKAEGAELAGEALEMTAADAVPDETRAVAYASGALLAIDGAHDSVLARAWFEAAADITSRMQRLDNPLLRLIGPMRAVFQMAEPGSAPPPAGVFDAAIDDPDPWLSATARLIRGHVALNFGRQHAEAATDFGMAWEKYSELGERWGKAFALVSLAILDAWRGEHAAAISHCEQALVLASELGTTEDTAQIRVMLAREFWLLGKREQARAALARAEHEAERVGLPDLRASVALTAGDLSRLDGDLPAAASQLAAAAALTDHKSVGPQCRAMIGTARGLLAAAEGDLDAARRHHRAALAAGTSAADAPVVAQVLVGLADLAMREGDPGRAAGLLGASVAIRGAPDQSVPDAARVADAALAALSESGYDAAYRRGQACTMATLTNPAGLARLTGLPSAGRPTAGA